MSVETNERGNTIERGFFLNRVRYFYDFGPCSSSKGWVQFDTEQDAPYFGTWYNPDKREVFTFCEGDTTLVKCPSKENFEAELNSMRVFYGSPPPAFIAIDTDSNTVTKYYSEDKF